MLEFPAIDAAGVHNIPAGTTLINKTASQGFATAEDAASTRAWLGVDSGLPVSLFALTGQGTIGNSTAETTLLSTAVAADYQGSKSISAFLKGGAYRWFAAGTHTGKPSAAGTLTFRAKLGSVVVDSVTIPDSLENLNAGKAWVFSGMFTVHTVAAAGHVRGALELHWTKSDGDVRLQPDAFHGEPVDLTTSQDLDLTAQWSVADVDNVLTIESGLLEYLGPNS